MKQAKFALVATTVLAVVGGVTALRGDGTTTIYTKVSNTIISCTKLSGTGYITGLGVLTSFATVPGICSFKYYISKQE
ncbi:hypothetical protein DVR12_19440 [Chitinophaga silvatica]|uniref:Uncharacterized protein n=1 Tax=Chitinophaga silvatica TaxID=2282649 RepID=A0A3E1Y7M6_9BACT|nr:hypothetical protein [Chitinophaga silvatica]RFS20733.1 hypothetical protein DVR12_19440 [Chitinophaga silvatica]